MNIKPIHKIIASSILGVVIGVVVLSAVVTSIRFELHPRGFAEQAMLKHARHIEQAFRVAKKVHIHPSAEFEANLAKAQVLPPGGRDVQVVWGTLGRQLAETGAVNKAVFVDLEKSRGGGAEEADRMLSNDMQGNIQFTEDNASMLLNLLWALGLANKNSILETGEMVSPTYGGDAGNFASTGGWTLAAGNSMDHYSKHQLVQLNDDQQKLVDEVSKNVYRPCCNNSTHFPDCNHGMAMLGLLELATSQSRNEEELYAIAATANKYWFPDQYVNVHRFIAAQKSDWPEPSSKDLVGAGYVSASGYQNILRQIAPVEASGRKGGCSV